MGYTCLVIGANGFIGSYLVEGLAARGYHVLAFDRYSQVPQFGESKNIEIIKGDVFNEPDIYSALQSSDYIFHCFSATTPFSSENDPLSDIELNLQFSVRLFEAAASKGIKKIIYLSSGGAIYGKSSEDRMVSEDDIALPVSPYGICKLATENYLAYFMRKFNMEYVAYRVTNPYGPRQIVRHNQGVIPAFLDKVRNHEEITVYGDGSSSRDYIYIQDVADMITGSFQEATEYNTYNIGSGRQTSLKEIIATIEQITDIKIAVNYVDAPKTFLNHSKIDVTRFEKEFGARELMTIEQGISKMLKSIYPK